MPHNTISSATTNTLIQHTYLSTSFGFNSVQFACQQILFNQTFRQPAVLMIGSTNTSTLISISLILQEADTVTVHIQLNTTLVQAMDRESYNGDRLGY